MVLHRLTPVPHRGGVRARRGAVLVQIDPERNSRAAGPLLLSFHPRDTEVGGRGEAMIEIGPVNIGDQLRRAFVRFPSGITAVCAAVDGAPVALAAGSFTAVSSSLPRSVCIQHTSATRPVLRVRPRLGLSVLVEGHDDACRRLAGKQGDRFAGTSWAPSENGAR
jgi:hypothetical protein